MTSDRRHELRDAAFRHTQSLSTLVSSMPAGVDEALPGLAFADLNNWSSQLAGRSQ